MEIFRFMFMTVIQTSFWRKRTAITEEQKKFIGITRNMCNYSGYESVALIPLEIDANVIGLVHVADPRENMFTAEKIAELEQIAEESASIIKHANEITAKLLKMDKMIRAAEH
jgi:GAF domain-containing protein